MRKIVKKYTPWVTPLNNGKFRVSQKYVDPLRSVPGKLYLRKVSITINKNTAQARNLALAELDKKINKVLSEQGMGTDITLKELSDKYQKFLKASDRPWNTRNTIFYAFESINRYFDKIIAKKLTQPMLNKYFNYLLYFRKPRTYSNSSVKMRKGFISAMYDFGIEQGYVSINPVKGMRVKWKNESIKKKERIENKFLTDTELRAILGYTKYLKRRKDYYYLFKLLSETGMRLNEATGLKKTDLHIGKETYIKVTGSQEYRNGFLARLEDGGPSSKKSNRTKTPAGFRKILISKKLGNMLKSINNGSSYLLVNESTKAPFKTVTVNSFLKVAARKLGINKHLSSHYFRHTYISKLAEQRIPLNLIMQQVGQQDSDVTKKIYTHITEQETNELKHKLTTIFDD